MLKLHFSFLYNSCNGVFRFLAVESMRQGLTPTDAAEQALARINTYYPSFAGALIAVNITGHYGRRTLLSHVEQQICDAVVFILN